MKSKLQIEVEPLSEARWSKIEAGLFEQMDREGRISAPPARRAPVAFFKRRAVVMGAVGFAAAAAFAAVAGRSLFEGGGQSPAIQASRIVTGTSPSHVVLGTSALEVSPESAVVASGDDKQGLLVVLEKGSVDCEVAPRKGRPPFVVLAGDVRVKVVGTRFVVTRAPEGVSVRVDHGVVEVARGGETKVLHDGEQWSEAKTASESPSVAPAPVPAAPSEEPAAAHVPSKGKAPHVAPTGATDPNSDQKAFERAASLEVRDAETALATYRRLGAGSGAWAAPSLYAAGRLAADRGRGAEARTLLTEYLRRFPSGPNARDARRLLAELR